MPDIVRKGITITEAYQQAAAYAPVGRAMLYAYELWHESFAAPVRFVNDKAPLTATLEADAPRGPASTVTFVACPLSVDRPEESDSSATPKVTLARPDIAGILKAALDGARGSLVPWEIIERVYASDDASTPAVLPPLKYLVTSTELAGAAASLTAQYDDDGNVAVPRITFKRTEYPGLQR